MSAQAGSARAVGVHPLRNISFSDPAVAIERTEHGDQQTVQIEPRHA